MPLAGATPYGEDLGQTKVSEAVAGTIAKSLSGVDAYDVLSRLMRNATNVVVYSYVDLTSYAVLANLPYDVVKILPWEKVTSGATGAPPDGMPGFVNVLVQPGQMFYKGLVALGTFLVNLGEAIVDWGMKQLGPLWNNIVGVAQTAWRWLSDETTAAAQYVASALRDGLSYLRQLLLDYVDGIVTSLLSMIANLPNGTTRVGT